MATARIPLISYQVHAGLAVYAFGQGEPILFMPGPHRLEKPGDRMADALIQGLTHLGRQVITYDPPGSGRSTRPAHLGMTEMHECADEALAVVGVMGAVDVLGHSMGGLAALAYALERPDHIKRLILVGTGAGGPAYMNAPGALWERHHPAFYRMAALSLLHILWPRRAPEQILMNFIQRQSFHDPRYAKPLPVTLADWLRPRQARTDWHRVARKLDYAPRLSTVQAPTLVLCGRYDPQYPPSSSQQLADSIPHARLALFEHSGHYPFIEEADLFWQAVGSFLKVDSG